MAEPPKAQASLAQVIMAIFFYLLPSPDWFKLFRTRPIPPLKQKTNKKTQQQKKIDQPPPTNMARFIHIYIYRYHCMGCRSQGVVPLQLKLIQALTAAAPPLPPSPPAHSQPVPGTTDCATALSSHVSN